MLRRYAIWLVCFASYPSALARAGDVAELDQAISRHECANFNGLWRGTCTTTAGAQPAAVTVTQDACVSLSFGGSLVLRFGGMSSVQSTAADLTESFIMKVDWDAAKRAAHYDLVKESRSLLAPGFTNAHVVGSMYFKAGHLNDDSTVTFSSTDANGTVTTGTDFNNCQYSRVP